ncbi:DUF6671 family protein [Cyanobium gracile]|uniref:DUF6671 family protein n=1 Tax=Cyanobium gracile UHCC 0281 TaxID=3110309 RepID=A0ABU5SW95_9CYAN|nr:DUF6671 family protein [Cyanobium gracile]MEA5442610.1 DUF6671 family protein [Cyanobium gracile UHCC 0281]
MCRGLCRRAGPAGERHAGRLQSDPPGVDPHPGLPDCSADRQPLSGLWALGWGRCEGLVGLLCAWCGQPTQRLQAEVWRCVACGHREEKPRRDGLLAADPGDCTRCNP